MQLLIVYLFLDTMDLRMKLILIHERRVGKSYENYIALFMYRRFVNIVRWLILVSQILLNEMIVNETNDIECAFAIVTVD